MSSPHDTRTHTHTPHHTTPQTHPLWRGCGNDPPQYGQCSHPGVMYAAHKCPCRRHDRAGQTLHTPIYTLVHVQHRACSSFPLSAAVCRSLSLANNSLSTVLFQRSPDSPVSVTAYRRQTANHPEDVLEMTLSLARVSRSLTHPPSSSFSLSLFTPPVRTNHCPPNARIFLLYYLHPRNSLLIATTRSRYTCSLDTLPTHDPRWASLGTRFAGYTPAPLHRMSRRQQLDAHKRP